MAKDFKFLLHLIDIFPILGQELPRKITVKVTVYFVVEAVAKSLKIVFIFTDLLSRFGAKTSADNHDRSYDFSFLQKHWPNKTNATLKKCERMVFRSDPCLGIE